MGIGVSAYAAKGAASADCGRVADLKFGHYNGCAVEFERRGADLKVGQYMGTEIAGQVWSGGRR